MNEFLSLKFKTISFLSIILVVFLHSYNLIVNLGSDVISLRQGYSSVIQNFFSQGICRVAVPIFFAISGYLFFLKTQGSINEFISKLQKRIKTILIPYLFWSVLWFVIFVVLQSIPELSVFFSQKLIADYSTVEKIKTVFLLPIPYQLWFLRDLMLLAILSPLLFYLLKSIKFGFLILIFLIWFFDINLIILSNESLFFFILGSFISIHYDKILLIKFGKKAWLYFTVWITIIIIKTLILHFQYEFGTLLTFLHKLSVIFGVLAIWSLYDRIVLRLKKTSDLKYMNYSFFIYIFHEPMLQFVKKALFYITNNSELMSLIIYILAPVLVIFICLGVGILLKRTIPKFYLFICGGR
ncbi:hypothetical protein IX39_04450 [Chryseobacterium formosense]|uniref:Acyltransferase 3 domain-containing protein n=1 Tax=Chryseobacterium formosense TaxID=236814 RepID=A0A085Z643_9FLAO|nr:acyltransferase [Chryseobacterium formosense]KFE99906.1 hypothetical protein IX39_04450 [Chryseobacterium formosense]SFT59860.1 Surface polysaccharide O-acyltransferase, integral membrane enzyme [Chryseobacterium formosense]